MVDLKRRTLLTTMGAFALSAGLLPSRPVRAGKGTLTLAFIP